MRTKRAAKSERTVVRSMTRVEGDDWTSIYAILSCHLSPEFEIVDFEETTVTTIFVPTA